MRYCSNNKYEVVDTNTLRNFPLKNTKLKFVVPKELDESIKQAEEHMDE